MVEIEMLSGGNHYHHLKRQNRMSEEIVIQRDGNSIIVHPAVEQYLLTVLKDGEMLCGDMVRSKIKARTIPQNSSIHLYCDKIAKAFNAAGYDQKAVLEAFNGVELENTMLSIKNDIWRRIQTILTGKESTTELETTEVDLVYRNVDTLTKRLGITLAWPDRFSQGRE